MVEVGTRSGDGMNCFARTASEAYAIEAVPAYCEALEARAARLRASGAGNYTVACGKFPEIALPDADYYTWWQDYPDLSDKASG